MTLASVSRRLVLAMLTAACAHTPQLDVAATNAAVAADSVRVIREAVRSELLAVAYRPGDQLTLALKLYGTPTYLGVIDYTGTSKTNHEATTPFNNTGDALCGKMLLMRATTDAFVLAVSANTATVTTTTGVPIGTNERVIQLMTSTSGGKCWIAAIRSSVSGNLSVWEMQ